MVQHTRAMMIRLGIILCMCLSTAAAAEPGLYEPAVDPALGFNMVSWWNFGGNGASVWTDAVQEMYDAGFSEVSISPVRFVTQGTGHIPTSSMQGPELAHIEAGIVRAKSLGMRVTLNPFVELQNFAFWRGQYDPSPGSAESNTFWSDYEQYIVDVATLAEAHEVEAITIGTELKAIVQNSGNNAQWSSLISAVDNVFSGDIGYAANWDNFRNGNLASTIWDDPAIDFMGIDAYFRIVTNGQADASGTYPDASFLDLVEANWHNQLDNDILPFAAARQSGAGMDVVFTEYGVAPFNRGITQQSTGTVDQAEQLMAFEGLLRALDGRQQDIDAMHIWQWGMDGSAGSNFYMDPDLTSNIGGGFDESLNTLTADWLSSFVSNPLLIDADFNNDGMVNGVDIDQLVENIAIGPPDVSVFDINQDGAVDLMDRDEWLAEAGALLNASNQPFLLGDANLDGTVDGDDFGIWNEFKFSATAAWTSADFNADGVVDGFDFLIWNTFKFQSSDLDIAVPEPSSAAGAVWLVLLTAFAVRAYSS